MNFDTLYQILKMWAYLADRVHELTRGLEWYSPNFELRYNTEHGPHAHYRSMAGVPRIVPLECGKDVVAEFINSLEATARQFLAGMGCENVELTVPHQGRKTWVQAVDGAVDVITNGVITSMKKKTEDPE